MPQLFPPCRLRFNVSGIRSSLLLAVRPPRAWLIVRRGRGAELDRRSLRQEWLGAGRLLRFAPRPAPPIGTLAFLAGVLFAPRRERQPTPIMPPPPPHPPPHPRVPPRQRVRKH